MATDDLADRVAIRLQRLGIGAVEAAARVPTLERNYIRDLVEGKKRSFSQGKLAEVAQALEWSVPELLGDRPPPQHRQVGRSTTLVPLLDSVTAGRLTSPSSQIPVEDVPLLAFADLGRGDFFALRVEGTSMDRQSPEGSIVVVNRADRTLVAGRSYIFYVKKEGTTYKRWHPGPPAYLEPNSTFSDHKPIFVKKSETTVIGRVRRTLMDL